MRSGTYQVEVGAFGPSGFQPASAIISVSIHNDKQVKVSTLFHNIEKANAGLFAFRSIEGYRLGDNVVLRGQTFSDRCVRPMPYVVVEGEFFREDMPWIKIGNSTVSDRNGNFEITFKTDQSMKFGTYKVMLKGKYNNEDYLYWEKIKLDDIKKFTFEADNKVSSAEVMVKYPGSEVVSFTLDKEAKKLVFVGNATDDRAAFDIIFPHDLLSGDIVIRKDEMHTLVLSENDALYGEDIQTDRGLYPSFSLYAHTYQDFTLIEYSYFGRGESKLEITGTNVITEFSIILTMLVASFAGLIVIARYACRWII
jgi:hypothetical protein